MKKPILFFLLVMHVCLTFPNCKKDGGSNSDRLTSDFWKVESVTFDDVNGNPFGGDLDAELMDYSDCAKQIQLSFKPEGDWTFEGGDVCTFEDAYNSLGTWAFSPDETSLYLENGSFGETWELVSLTSKKLVLKFYDCTSCGGQYSVSFDVTLTLKH